MIKEADIKRMIKQTVPTVPLARTVCAVFDGGGSAPEAGSIGYAVCLYNGTIDRWDIVANAAGNAVVDVWKVNGAVPTVSDSIAGSDKPTLSGQQLANGTGLTGWSKTVSTGDVFGFRLDSASGVNRVTVSVRMT